MNERNQCDVSFTMPDELSAVGQALTRKADELLGPDADPGDDNERCRQYWAKFTKELCGMGDQQFANWCEECEHADTQALAMMLCELKDPARQYVDTDIVKAQLAMNELERRQETFQRTRELVLSTHRGLLEYLKLQRVEQVKASDAAAIERVNSAGDAEMDRILNAIEGGAL